MAMVFSSKESSAISKPIVVLISLESLESLVLQESFSLEAFSSKVDPCSLLSKGFPISSTSMGSLAVLENSSQ